MTRAFGRTRHKSYLPTRRAVVVATAVGIGLIAATAAFAGSAGDLDRSFGQHGLVVVRKIDRAAEDAAVGGHNRIVAVAGHGAFKITRRLPNGNVEKGFGHRGVVTVRFGSKEAIPESVAIDRKGGIVIAGRVCPDVFACHFGVARLRPNGNLDRDFGGDGKVEIHFPKLYIFLDTWVALGAGGRIVVGAPASESRSSDELEIALAALRSDGSLDPRFGTGGKVVSSFAPAGDQCVSGYGQMTGMALDSSDRIVVTDNGCPPGVGVSVARFKRSGELDPSFGGDGLVNRKLGMSAVEALAIDKRDRIDLMGDRREAFVVARLRTDGGLDRSFGKDGRAKVVWRKRFDRFGAHVSSGAIDSRGRIVIAGAHSKGLAFARFKPNGHTNRRFGHRGKVVVRDPRRGFHLGWLSAVAIDTRDRIIASGREKRGHDRSGSSHLALVRLLG